MTNILITKTKVLIYFIIKRPESLSSLWKKGQRYKIQYSLLLTSPKYKFKTNKQDQLKI